MILVTGATGHFGKAAIQYLLNKGVPANNIAALVRDEAKAADLQEKGIIIRKGDYEDYPSLVEAFMGIDKLLLVSSSDVANRSGQQANAIKAAKEAGVKYILYTSFERKNDTNTSPIAFVAKAHLESEQDIKASGISYTIFRNNLYMDFIPMFIGQQAADTGVYWPAGNGKLAAALRDDMAESAANVLISDVHYGKTYSISGNTNISFTDVASTLGSISGKNVGYISPSGEEYIATVTKAGMPGEYANMFAAFAEAIKQGEFESSASDLERLLGRKPISAEEYLKTVYA